MRSAPGGGGEDRAGPQAGREGAGAQGEDHELGRADHVGQSGTAGLMARGTGEEAIYIIIYEDGDTERVSARIASDALVMAEDLVAQGWTDVRIETPEGEVHPVRRFARLLREGSV